MSTLIIGDRVECAGATGRGTVEYADSEYVRVAWDDGKIGLLYFDDRMLPNARYLLRLATPAPEEQK